MNKPINVVARLLLSLPFAVFGLFHLMNAPMMAGMVPAYVPGGVLWVYITGAAMLLAVVSFNIRRHDRLAGLLLALLLFSFAFTVQLPGMLKPAAATDALAQAYKMAAMAGFFKDLGLAGGALLIASTSKA
jgi:uncharacterized membrane protein YphA (DoxX/SURF4 family)